MTTEELFAKVYTQFKMHFYRAVFRNFENREATLTTVETFCMEVIHAMGRPTINEFASFCACPRRMRPTRSIIS